MITRKNLAMPERMPPTLKNKKEANKIITTTAIIKTKKRKLPIVKEV